jgi:hypothetical protein
MSYCKVLLYISPILKGGMPYISWVLQMELIFTFFREVYELIEFELKHSLKNLSLKALKSLNLSRNDKIAI